MSVCIIIREKLQQVIKLIKCSIFHFLVAKIPIHLRVDGARHVLQQQNDPRAGNGDVIPGENINPPFPDCIDLRYALPFLEHCFPAQSPFSQVRNQLDDYLRVEMKQPLC